MERGEGVVLRGSERGICRRRGAARHGARETPLTINPLIGDGLIASNYPESRASGRTEEGKNKRALRAHRSGTTCGERDAGLGYRTAVSGGTNRLGTDMLGN